MNKNNNLKSENKINKEIAEVVEQESKIGEVVNTLEEVNTLLDNIPTESIVPKKELENMRVRAKEDLGKNETQKKIEPDLDLDIIKKLKCNYAIFKNERIKNKMFVPNNCQKCNKHFENDDNIYFALTKKKNELFICKKCAEK